MAIIKGMKTADMGSITPYNEDIDKLASGILAREGRAEETRNAIADARNQMLLKETRDNSDDMALAQKLEQGFTSDVDAMLDKADADYSMISKGDLQRLAGDYMGKTEWRALTNAKIQTDIYNDEKRKAEAAGGTTTIFGTDPNTVSLYDEEGNINHLTGTFEVQKTLDHSQAAKDLFDALGYQINNIEKFNPPEGGDYHSYYKSWIDNHKDNRKQVDIIIENALDGFLADPEGKQYYRIHYENQKNLGVDHKQADEYARGKVKELIRTYGESEYIIEDTEKDKYNPLSSPKSPNSKSSNTGGPEDKSIIPNNITVGNLTSFDGLQDIYSDNIIDEYNNNNKTSNYQQNIRVANDNIPINEIGNNNLLIGSVTAVSNPEDPSNEGAGKNSGQLGFRGKDVRGGLLYTLDKNLLSKNRTVVTVNTNENIDSEIKKIENNISDLGENDNEEKIKYEEKLFTLKLKKANRANYNNLNLDDITVDNIVEISHDNLIQRDDVIAMLNKNQQFIKNANINDQATYAFIGNKNTDWESGSLSAFSTKENEGKLEMIVNPFFEKMKNYYNSKLNEISTLDESTNERIPNQGVNKNEIKLIQSKIKHIDNKITDANKFMNEDEKMAIENIKSQYSLNYHKNRNYESYLRMLAIDAGFIEEELSAGLHLNLQGKINDENILMTNIDHIEDDAQRESGINFNNSVENYNYYKKQIEKGRNFQNSDNYHGRSMTNWSRINGKADTDGSLKVLNDMKKAHNKFKSKILNSEYTLDDIKKTKFYNNLSSEVKKGFENGSIDLHEIINTSNTKYKEVIKDLLINEFDDAGLMDVKKGKISLMDKWDSKYPKAVNDYRYYLLGEEGPFGVLRSEKGEGMSQFRTPLKYEGGKLMFDSEVTDLIKKNKGVAIKKDFGTDVRYFNYINSVDDLNNSIDRKDLVFLFGKDYKENKYIYERARDAFYQEFTDPKREIRRSLYDNDKKGKEEKGVKQTIKTKIEAEYKKKTDEQKGKQSLSEYEKEWLLSKMVGVRLDYTNEGPIFVAQYKDGVDLQWEHNTEAILMSDAINHYGIEGARMKYTNILSKSLRENNGLFADLPNFNKKKPVRFHQALKNLTGKGGSQIKKGEFYIMEKKDGKVSADDYPGSTNYNMSNIKDYHLVPFSTMDEIFLHIKTTNSKAISNIESLQKQIADLDAGHLPSNYFSPTISDGKGGTKSNPLHNMTQEQAKEQLKKMVETIITGETPSTTITATTGTTTNKLPQNFQLPGS